MASNTFPDQIATYDRRIVELFGIFVVGATGAVTLLDARGFAISRLGVGNYRLMLDQPYPFSPARYVGGTPAQNVTSPLVSLDVVIQDAGTRVFRQMTITAINLTNGAVSSIDVIFDSAANTPGELNTGSIVRFALTLKNSSTPAKGL